MKKKILTITIFLALTAGILGCKKAGQQQKSLYDQGLDIIALMTEMAGNEDYINLSTGNSSIGEIVTEISSGDYSVPKNVYKVTFSEEALSTLISMSSNNSQNSFSDALSNYMLSRMNSVLISQINASDGAETLAAVSLCTAGKTFVNDDVTENIIYLYTYENARPAAVVFTPGEDGSVSATGNFIINDTLSTDKESDVKTFFENYSATVEIIKP